MNKYFLTFASADLNKTLSRIKIQAEDLNIYDKILIYSEKDLDVKFKQHFAEQLHYGVRGYGYWSWKPQVILQALELMQEGDILQYTDAGCHLNRNGIDRLNEYFDITDNTESGILAFQTKEPAFPLPYDGRKLLDCLDYKWIKGDLLDYFDIRSKDSILQSQTITATVIFIKKTPDTIRFVNQWLDVIKYDFTLIDDTKSNSPNMDGFIEHRHDQAIFSILGKIHNIQTVSSYEYWYPSKENIKKPDWKILAKYPILAKRDKEFILKSFVLVLIWRIGKKLSYYYLIFGLTKKI